MAGAGTLLVQPDTQGTTINTLPAPGQDVMAGSLPVAIASNQSPVPTRPVAAGLGALTVVPAASTNGTALGTMPTNAKGARLYVLPGGSLSYTIAASQPSAAPSAVLTVANPSANTVFTNVDEDLNGQMIYITATSGSPLFRWY